MEYCTCLHVHKADGRPWLLLRLREELLRKRELRIVFRAWASLLLWLLQRLLGLGWLLLLLLLARLLR